MLAPLDAARHSYPGWRGLGLDSGNARIGCGGLFGPLSDAPSNGPVIILGDVIGAVIRSPRPGHDRSIMRGLGSWRAVASRLLGRIKA
jgi:hypothetical protein